jgi:hypothetical protein
MGSLFSKPQPPCPETIKRCFIMMCVWERDDCFVEQVLSFPEDEDFAQYHPKKPWLCDFRIVAALEKWVGNQCAYGRRERWWVPILAFCWARRY